jgi:Xaa-Pro dipeptidase
MFTTRMARLRERMTETGTDLVVIGPTSSMVWLAGLSPHGDERPVMLMVSKDFAGFLIPVLNVDSARQHTDLPFFSWSDDAGPDGALAALLEATGAHRPGLRIALDETMRADFALLVLDALPRAERSFLYDTVGYLRARKDESEYRVLKANALINDGAMRSAFASLKPGISELEVADIVRDYYKANGTKPEFIHVCFGENGAFPHHHTGERKLIANEAVLIDIGGRSDGYPSDMTRVAFCGEPSEEFRKVHAVLQRAVVAAVAAAKPGARAMDVDTAAREIITDAGYGAFFLHRTGHGMGIDIHEPPYITATAETILEDGHVFSIEPGIYLSGKFGIRLEEIVIIRGDHAEILSELSRAAFEVTV